MINPSEVRIDNLVEYKGKIYRVNSISRDYPLLDTTEFENGFVKWEDLMPITISQKVLIDMGFQQRKSSHHLIVSEGDCVICIDKGFCVGIYDTEDNFKNGLYIIPPKSIEKIHDLQNFFNSISGTELRINLN